MSSGAATSGVWTSSSSVAIAAKPVGSAIPSWCQARIGELVRWRSCVRGPRPARRRCRPGPRGWRRRAVSRRSGVGDGCGLRGGWHEGRRHRPGGRAPRRRSSRGRLPEPTSARGRCGRARRRARPMPDARRVGCLHSGKDDAGAIASASVAEPRARTTLSTWAAGPSGASSSPDGAAGGRSPRGRTGWRCRETLRLACAGPDQVGAVWKRDAGGSMRVGEVLGAPEPSLQLPMCSGPPGTTTPTAPASTSLTTAPVTCVTATPQAGRTGLDLRVDSKAYGQP